MNEIILIYTVQILQNFKHTLLNLEVAWKTDGIHLFHMLPIWMQ